MTGKFDAMVTILNWLESGRTVTPQTIMDELSVSARTTYRYLTTLQEAGFPLFFNKDRGSYAFAEGYALRKPHLNLRENLTFSLAKVSLKTMGGGMDKELASIERKLASPFRELPPHIIVAADEFSVDIREWFSITGPLPSGGEWRLSIRRPVPARNMPGSSILTTSSFMTATGPCGGGATRGGNSVPLPWTGSGNWRCWRRPTNRFLLILKRTMPEPSGGTLTGRRCRCDSGLPPSAGHSCFGGAGMTARN